jgi:hypothetical protein
MKRLVVLVAVIVPLSVISAGCGGSGGSPSTAKTMTSEQREDMKAQMQKGFMKGHAAAAPSGGGTPSESDKK